MRRLIQQQQGPALPSLALALALLATTASAFLLPSSSPSQGSASQALAGRRAAPWAASLVVLEAKKGEKKQQWTPPENEFSRCIDLDDVSRKPTWMKMEANEEERDALAERFEFVNLKHLSANVSVSRPRWGCLLAKGALRAALDRHCVVTGELFPYKFETEFSTYIKEVGGAVPLYGSEEEEDWGQGANDMDDDDFDDEVEAGTELDVGEIVAQYLYLLMPPYPTLPGKSLDDIPDEVIFEFGDLDEGSDDGGGKKKKQKPSW